MTTIIRKAKKIQLQLEKCRKKLSIKLGRVRRLKVDISSSATFICCVNFLIYLLTTIDIGNFSNKTYTFISQPSDIEYMIETCERD